MSDPKYRITKVTNDATVYATEYYRLEANSTGNEEDWSAVCVGEDYAMLEAYAIRLQQPVVTEVVWSSDDAAK